MTAINLRCPQCLFEKQISIQSIPAGTTRVKCPRCGSLFPLPGQTEPEEPAEPSAQTHQSKSTEPIEPAAQNNPAPPPFRHLVFEFRGTGSQYFGIWIVNTLLQILTLGIYSPWAKVRKRQFFYGNSLLDGAPFDYLASAWVLLRGWLLGAALFIAYSLCSQLLPPLAMILAFIFYLLIPWIIVRSRIFNTRNSAHRAVRFGFNPNFSESYKVFAWLPLLLPFTLGLIFPYLLFRQRRFLTTNSRFGTTAFTFDARPGQYYKTFLKVSLLSLLPTAGIVIAMSLMASGLGEENPRPHPALALLAPALMLIFWLLNLYLQTCLSNLAWNSTGIAGARFRSTLSPARVMWIQCTNLLGILLSAGLFTPWATVRMVRYRLGCISLEGQLDPDAFVAEQARETGAAGEELADIFDIEIAL